ncbi:MAG: choice-of-anchor D domain-containing protein [Bacteroidetes bacterium]|nr:MAG: choice-of-anchor D domain-containing protein [Bacteroidota bacterium]
MKSILFSIFVLFFLVAIISLNAQVIVDSNTVALWNFNENSGNVLHDLSPYHNDGTIYGNTSWVEGKYGKALYFDGLTSYVKVINSTSLKQYQEFTLEAWIFLDTLGFPDDPRHWDKTRTIVDNLGPYPYGGGFFFGYHNGYGLTFNYRANNGNSNFSDGVEITEAKRFYHVAQVFQRKKLGSDSVTVLKTYLDGQLKDSTVHSEPIQYSSTPYLYIGTNSGGLAVGGDGIREFKGIIDEIRISKVARDPSEFMYSYLAAVPGNLDFGFVEAGQSLTKQLKLFNTSDSDTMSIDSILISNSEFTYSGALTPILPQDSLLLDVTYAPTGAGVDVAQLSIAVQNSDIEVTEVRLSGRGYTAGMDTNIVADWHFDEGAGNMLYDGSLYANDGTIYNAEWVEGKQGKALHFDGYSSYVKVANSASLKPQDEFTIEAWINLDGLEFDDYYSGNKYAVIISNLGSSPWGGYQLYLLQDSGLVFEYRSNYGTLYSGYSPITMAKTYYHVAQVYNRVDSTTYLKTYVNGILTDSTVYDYPIQYSSTPNFYIGTNYGGRAVGGYGVREFPGIIDELRISKVERDPSEFNLMGIAASTGALSFDEVLVGQTQTRQVTVTNISFTDTVAVDVHDGSNPEITVDQTSFVLPPRGEQVVNVTYSPTETGADTALVTFAPTDSTLAAATVHVTGFSYQLYPQPVITSVSDIPNDQGRLVRIIWYPSMYDNPTESLKVNEYSVWRKVDDIENEPQSVMRLPHDYPNRAIVPLGERTMMVDGGELWDFVTTLPAVQFNKYAIVTATLYNTSYYQEHWTTFRIAAHTTTGEFFFSDADSGYSMDNVYPYAPASFYAEALVSRISLSWMAPADPDVWAYKLYRSTVEDFTPSADNFVATVYSRYYTDYNVTNSVRYYYAITTVDSNGNESKQPSRSEAMVVLGIGDETGIPTEYALSQNYPNPFNPTTVLKYQLPVSGYVTLKIYNVLGEEVATLVDGNQEPGYKSVPFDASGLSSGVYLYRLTAGTYSAVQKMLLIK